MEALPLPASECLAEPVARILSTDARAGSDSRQVFLADPARGGGPEATCPAVAVPAAILQVEGPAVRGVLVREAAPAGSSGGCCHTDSIHHSLGLGKQCVQADDHLVVVRTVAVEIQQRHSIL